jgi:DNA-binding NarL/FixJ family response regulator
MTSVLLVDDHELIRQGLARAFERVSGFEVLGQAGTVAQARSMWAALRPDAVVTDLQLPDGTGIDVVRSVRAESAATGIVVLTLHAADPQILAAMEAGASAFLGKESRGDEVVAAVGHAVRSPGSFLCTGLAGAVMRRTATAASRLSGREQAILELVAEGARTDEIARRLYLAESTVKAHLGRVYRKLDVTNRTQALAAARRLGLLLDAVPVAV